MNDHPFDTSASGVHEDDFERRYRAFAQTWRNDVGGPPDVDAFLTELLEVRRRPAWYRRPMTLGIAAAAVVVAVVAGAFAATGQRSSSGPTPPVASIINSVSPSALTTDPAMVMTTPTKASATPQTPTTTEASVKVPSVIGMTIVDAEQALGKAGLKFVIKRVTTLTGSDTVVKAQDPSAYYIVAPGSTVVLLLPPESDDFGDPVIRDPSATPDPSTFMPATGDYFRPGTFIGKTEADATKAVTNLRLRIGIVQVYSSTPQEGLVLAQNPEPIAAMLAGWKVTLYVGVGPRKADGVAVVTVPQLVGVSESDAKDILTRMDLKYVLSTRRSDDTRKGTVTDQDTGFQVVSPGTVISLTIGTGQLYSTMPDVTGISYTQAAQKLQDLHLVPKKISINGADPLNQVEKIASKFKVGDRLGWDTVVYLAVSDNSLMKMPTITGDDLATAVDSLQKAGWTGKTASDIQQGPPVTTTDPSKNERVVQQNPVAGTFVAKKSQIFVQLGNS